MHASSVGEVRVLDRLMKSLKIIKPDCRLFISAYTRTGQELTKDLFSGAEAVFIFPLDCYFPLKRMFSHFRPDGIVMVETEIWPYFLSFCRKLEIPLILANGRLSEKSTSRYRIFRNSLAALFISYRRFIMQTDEDAKRIISIGAESEKVISLGNIKHDPIDDKDRKDKRKEVLRQLNIDNDALFFIAASTRPGEEEVICEAMKLCSSYIEKMIVLLAPRHLERLSDVERIIQKSGFDFIRYSALVDGKIRRASVILMDKMGVLSELFYGADIAFVGGTIADLGGHNIMEPVLAGAPVLFGPSVYNVKEAAEKIIDSDQGSMIKDSKEMAEEIIQYLTGKDRFEIADTSGPSVAEQTAGLIVKEFGL
jgi:3-deoxy-D-manno-octulosonic-acid transferase